MSFSWILSASCSLRVAAGPAPPSSSGRPPPSPRPCPPPPPHHPPVLPHPQLIPTHILSYISERGKASVTLVSVAQTSYSQSWPDSITVASGGHC
ncbi:hypothetical protein F5X96DRAFT_614141 [Biscogniauxia mediterranea]|nr:hypothetical protein F5X96DRAFT_614141 [Biscogniauxia mediterranea]